MRPRRVFISFLAALLALIWGFSSFQISRADTYIVTNTDDDGAGSLRQAIANANASVGVLDTIQFSIDTGTQTIFLLSPLNITDPVILDGTTQPGFTGSPLIILDGVSAGAGANGIIISGGGSTISGLSVGRFEGAGIQIAGSGSVIIGNYIGTDGVNPLPNGIGIEILGSGNRVGGTVGGSGNLITNNVGPSILIDDGGVPGAAVNNAILGNAIFDNGGLGIDLFPPGVTPNDAGDTDGGPNNLQNFPVITAATPGSVTGTLASAPDTTYRIEFYRNTACDSSTYGEGENYLDFLDVTTDGAGDASFSISTLPLTAGDFLTVTATAPNNDTSEFSECVEVVDAPIYLSDPLPDPDPGSLLTIFTTEGVPASAIIQVRNPGTAELNVTQVSLDNLTDFSLLSAASFNVPAGGGPVTIEIQCDADTGPGLFTTGVTVEHNAAGSPASYTVDCDVASVPTPVYISAPAPGEVIDLGTTAFGSSVTGSLHITNLGTANLTVSEPAAGFFSGANAADFSLVAGTAPPFTLGPSDDWTVIIRCTPLAAGDRTAILTFDTTDPVRPSVSYTLNCRALLLLSPTTLPDGAVGVLYPDQTITANGGSGSYAFDLFSGSLPPGLTLSPGGLLSGTPTLAGTFPFTVRATDNADNSIIGTQNYTIIITDAVPGYDSSPAPSSTITVGTATVGTPVSTTLTVSETGNAPLDVGLFGGSLATAITGANAADFTITAPAFPFTIADGGANQPITIQCTPAAEGLRTATLTLTSNDPAWPTIAYPLECTGTVVLTPGYDSSPAPNATITVGTATVGTPVTTTLTVSETGSAPLDVGLFGGSLATAITGANAADFTITAPAFPFTIADGGANQPITIQCTPAAEGLRTATLTLTSNDPTWPTIAYPLECTGTVVLTPGYDSSPAPGSTITVGTATVGTPVSTTLTVSETGNAPLDVGLFGGSLATAITGANAADFTITAPAFPFTIADGGANQPITIQCTPAAEGLRTATLTLTSNDPAWPTIAYPLECTGTVVLTPGYDSSPAPTATITVGTATVGTPVTTTLTVSETGSAPLDVGLFGGSLATAITGANAADFTITAPAFPFTIADGGANQPITIQCTPAAEGLRTATLTLTSNDPTWPTIAYPLECTGTVVLTPIYQSVPAPGSTINLTTTQDSPVSANIAVSNPGSAPLNVTSVVLSNSGNFSLLSAASFSVPAGGGPTDIIVQCNADEAHGTPYTTTVTVTHDAAGNLATYTVNCTVNAPADPGYDSSPAPNATISVGTATVGTPVSTTLTVSETGGAALTVGLFGGSLATAITGANAADFTITNPAFPFTIADGGANQPITIQCTPATEGARTATLTLTSNDPAWPTIAYPLQCTGALVATPSYSSIPAPGSTINIGTTQVGVALVKADALQISENGTAALAVGNPSIIGTNAGDFRITSPAFPITIADGGAPQNVAIECNPTGTGARTATLTLATNDPSQPTVQYTLTCTGTAAAAPGYGSVPAPGSFINLNTIPGVPVNAQIIVSETGTATLTITSITLSDNLNFTLITPNTFQIVNGGPSENVFIRCNALGLGTFVTAVTVAHNAAGSPANYTITCNVTTTPIATPTLIITGVPTAVGPTAIPPTATPAAPGTGTISDEVKGQAIRTGPYLGATLMGGALPGQQYPILARSTDEGGEYAWYLIQAGAITGWTSGRYLRFTGDPSLLPSAGSIFDQIDGAPDVGVTAVLPALTDMRRRPSGRAAILRTLPQGAVVSVIGRTRQNGGNYWLHVRFEGQIGWIPAYVENVRGSWENVPIR